MTSIATFQPHEVRLVGRDHHSTSGARGVRGEDVVAVGRLGMYAGFARFIPRITPGAARVSADMQKLARRGVIVSRARTLTAWREFGAWRPEV